MKEDFIERGAERRGKERRKEKGQKKGQELNADHAQVIGLLVRLQEQVTFLERKVDHLTNMLARNAEKAAQLSRAQSEGKTFAHKSKERKFSRDFAKSESHRSKGPSTDKSHSFSKFGGKKKSFAAKKNAGGYKKKFQK